MGSCMDCGLSRQICVCHEVVDYMDENEDLLQDLTELEDYEKSNKSRCLACFFFDCRCKEGLANKKL